jgi:predicted dinucleotide-binding enzyme
MEKIGVIGSGNVGKVLAEGFIKYGYDVMLGSRDIKKLADWKSGSGRNTQTGTFEQTAKFGDILVLAVKGTGAISALESAGRKNITSKIIIDATNPIAYLPPENGVIKFFTSLDKSLMEELQETFTDAKFVKAFNSVGSALMINPDFGNIKPSMFICGNDEAAKKSVAKIVELFGFEVLDMGQMQAARAIEPLCILWCIPGFLYGKWTHAFKLLKKK